LTGKGDLIKFGQGTASSSRSRRHPQGRI